MYRITIGNLDYMASVGARLILRAMRIWKRRSTFHISLHLQLAYCMLADEDRILNNRPMIISEFFLFLIIFFIPFILIINNYRQEEHVKLMHFNLQLSQHTIGLPYHTTVNNAVIKIVRIAVIMLCWCCAGTLT